MNNSSMQSDIKNATNCDLDNILKYFLYLVLEKDSTEKKELDRIQNEIESLQNDRYYGTNEDTGQSGADETEGVATETNERRETPNDYTFTEDEQKLVQHREKILDEILGEVLENVLPITNLEETRKLLQLFANELLEVETACYTPYVILCNYLLNTLKSVTTDFQVRSPDRLDIRFHRNDPQSIFEGVTDKPRRKPSVIITSLFAALQAGHLQVENRKVFSERPEINFQWQATLASIEFKVQNRKKIPTAGKFIETSASTTSRGPRAELDNLESWALSVADTDSSSHSEESVISKRCDDNEGISDSLHVSKKQRGPDSITSTLSGSNDNSTTDSTSTRYSQTESKTESQTMAAVDGQVKCASYAMEVLSYSLGVHHVINLLFTNDYLWIWYYDRQGIIQSNGMSIFSDFPRFLVLLFALQRFNLEDWGIIPSLNPKALVAHGLAGEGPGEEPSNSSSSLQQGTGEKATKGKANAKNSVGDKNGGPPLPIVLSSSVVLPLTENLKHLWLDDQHSLVEVHVDVGKFLSSRPRCLAGRATAVVSATGLTKTSNKTPMVCKIYHPEVQRRHEGLVLEVIHNIAKEHNPGMLRHLPTMYFHGDVPNTTTQRIRSMVGRSWKGHCVLRILALKKLDKITTVGGSQFVKAWLEIVTCHSFLWKHYVEHGDPSVANMMYDPEEKCGVLTDFDLSLLQWEPRVIGTDKTGTIPFMAIELLTKAYWNGRIKRCYYHELESFIWILPYVFLLYEAGTRRLNPHVDVWRTSHYTTCIGKKLRFLTIDVLNDAGQTVTPNFEAFWGLARALCRALSKFRYNQEERLYEFFPKTPPPSLGSNELWDKFITTLKSQYQEDHELHGLILCLEAQKPSFDELDATLREQLRNKFKPILQPKLDTGTNNQHK